MFFLGQEVDFPRLGSAHLARTNPFKQEDGEKEKRWGVTYISAGMARISFSEEILTLTPDPNQYLTPTSI